MKTQINPIKIEIAGAVIFESKRQNYLVVPYGAAADLQAVLNQMDGYGYKLKRVLEQTRVALFKERKK